jgi:hypothetical protein
MKFCEYGPWIQCKHERDGIFDQYRYRSISFRPDHFLSLMDYNVKKYLRL